jgi:hypothetical protein
MSTRNQFLVIIVIIYLSTLTLAQHRCFADLPADFTPICIASTPIPVSEIVYRSYNIKSIENPGAQICCSVKFFINGEQWRNEQCRSGAFQINVYWAGTTKPEYPEISCYSTTPTYFNWEWR